MKYEFHRDFYDLVTESIDNHSTTFLLGTRKCGKTVCLKQVAEEVENAKYVDFKECDKDERLRILDEVLADIRSDRTVVYLLDEITSVRNYDIEICKIAEAYTDLKNRNTKIVFSGSQSVALGVCADRAFAGNTNVISVDFLTYSEFLRFKGIQEVSADSYNQFLMEVFDFYDDFTSLRQYLEGCINETITSNMKASEIILGNETSLTKEDTDFLINVCYQTLFNLHNHVSAKRFFENEKLREDIPSYFRGICKDLDDDKIADKISKSFIGSYNVIKSRDVETVRQALLFLQKCDLITITPVANSMNDVPDIRRNIITGDKIIHLKDDLFSSFNISIKYPMFYVQILKDILGKDMPQKLPSPLLGSIVECNARGLLAAGFELKVSGKDENGVNVQKEVDLVDLKTSTATELTISKKHTKHFDIVPNYFKKIMLTKDVKSEQDGIIRTPYYEYLFELSQEKYMPHEISRGTKPPKQIYESISDRVNQIAEAVKGLKSDVSEMIAKEKELVIKSFDDITKQIKQSFEMNR
jgi:hypothetical protein